MKTETDSNFSTIITKIALYKNNTQLLIPSYQEFTEMRWETYLCEEVTDPASIAFL